MRRSLRDLTNTPEEMRAPPHPSWTLEEMLHFDYCGGMKTRGNRIGLFVKSTFTLQPDSSFKNYEYFRHFFQVEQDFAQKEKIVFFSQRSDSCAQHCPNFEKCLSISLIDDEKEDIIGFTECSECFTLCHVDNKEPLTLPTFNIEDKKCTKCLYYDPWSPNSGSTLPLRSPSSSVDAISNPSTRSPSPSVSDISIPGNDIITGENPHPYSMSPPSPLVGIPIMSYESSSPERSPPDMSNIPPDYEPASPIYVPPSPRWEGAPI